MLWCWGMFSTHTCGRRLRLVNKFNVHQTAIRHTHATLNSYYRTRSPRRSCFLIQLQHFCWRGQVSLHAILKAPHPNHIPCWLVRNWIYKPLRLVHNLRLNREFCSDSWSCCTCYSSLEVLRALLHLQALSALYQIKPQYAVTRWKFCTQTSASLSRFESMSCRCQIHTASISVLEVSSLLSDTCLPISWPSLTICKDHRLVSSNECFLHKDETVWA